MKTAESQNSRSVKELLKEMRLRAGAQEYSGHEYMDLNRFAEDTRHMVIFDVLSSESVIGWKGERTRAYLTDAGYQKVMESQKKNHIKILSHARVKDGKLFYDRQDSLR